MPVKLNKPSPTAPTIQTLLDESNQIEGLLSKLQNQINDLETSYLQRTWYDGNIYIGWNKNLPNPNPHHIKINIDSKEKLFSLSSITSPAFG